MDELSFWDRQGKCVFSYADIQNILGQKDRDALNKNIRRLIDNGALVRACNNIYVNPRAASFDPSTVIETIAVTLRRGEYSYLSLESALAEYGVISQIPMAMTIMTTGRRGSYKTPWGTLEFTNTSRAIKDVAEDRLHRDGRPLPIAPLEVALRDLRRVGRNLDMIDQNALEEIRNAQAEEPVFQPGI
jgi:hypothetical protein